MKELTRAIVYYEERGWDSKALESPLEAARGGYPLSNIFLNLMIDEKN